MSGALAKRFAGFVVGLLVGMIGSQWGNLKPTELLAAGMVFVVIGLLMVSILSVIPSKHEKLLEMKYFMRLFCREVPGR